MSLRAVQASDGSVYKQTKKTEKRAEEVSRYPNGMLNAVVGKMSTIYATNKSKVFGSS